MKKYGQAEYMWYVIKCIVEIQLSSLTPELRVQVLKNSEKTVFSSFPSVQDKEVET